MIELPEPEPEPATEVWKRPLLLSVTRGLMLMGTVVMMVTPVAVVALICTGLLALVTLCGGLATEEQQALGRATNWAFLMVLAGVGLTLRAATLRQLGPAPLLGALLGWAAAAAVLLGCVLVVP